MVDRAVTWGDLVENGIVTMRGADGKPILIKNPGGTFQPSTPPVVDGIPPAPTGFKATPGLGTVVLEGQAEFRLLRLRRDFPGHDEQPGAGRQRGPDDGVVYADPVGGNGGVTFFYWVRFVSVGGKLGPFNGVGGTTGAVSLDPAYLIDVLAAAGDPKALLYEVGADHQRRAGPAWHLHPHAVRGERLDRHAAAGQRGHHGRESGEPVGCQVTLGEMSGDRIAVNSLNADRLTVASSRRAWPSSPTPTSRRPTSRRGDHECQDRQSERGQDHGRHSERGADRRRFRDGRQAGRGRAVGDHREHCCAPPAADRTEFDANGIRVYHANGVLAVRVGIW